MPQASLTTQPAELLEAIILNIDDSKDLLSLALTSRAFCRSIIPKHIDFCNITCSPYRKDIWQFIAERPSRARRIRRLQLIWEPVCSPQYISLEIPRQFREATGVGSDATADVEEGWQSLVLLTSILPNMSHLISFAWTGPEWPQLDVWNEIKKAIEASGCSLREFHTETPWYEEREKSTGTSFAHRIIGNPASLTTLQLGIPWMGGNVLIPHDEHLADLIQVIASSYPSLKELALYRGYGPAQGNYGDEHLKAYAFLFENSTWPYLKKFTMDGIVPVLGEEAAIFQAGMLDSFLWRHPLLERVLIVSVSDRTYPLNITEQALPNLKAVEIRDSNGILPLDVMMDGEIPHSLEFLTASISKASLAILPNMIALRSCNISMPFDLLPSFCDAIPSTVERIRLSLSRSVNNADRTDILSTGIDCKYKFFFAVECLQELKSLTHFAQGNLSSWKPYYPKAQDDMITDLVKQAIRIPALKYFEPWRDTQVEVFRKPDGAFDRWERLGPRKCRNVASNSWGRFVGEELMDRWTWG